MPRDQSFLEFVCDQLRGLDGLRSRGMFGGYGLYAGEVFFGIVADGRLYFKTDGATRERYNVAGMGAFEPNPGQVLKNYFEVPVDVIEDDGELVAWAREAVRVGGAASERSKRRTPKKR